MAKINRQIDTSFQQYLTDYGPDPNQQDWVSSDLDSAVSIEDLE
jgi:hypothetical protein